MLNYKDRSFCSSTDCINHECSLLLTPSMSNDAQCWWNQDKPLKEWTEAPIAFVDYKDTEHCLGYKTQKE